MMMTELEIIDQLCVIDLNFIKIKAILRGTTNIEYLRIIEM